MTSRKLLPLAFRKVPPRKKQLLFVALATAALTLAAVNLLVGLVTKDTHWYLQSFGMLLLVAVGFLGFRQSVKEEREGLERESLDIE